MPNVAVWLSGQGGERGLLRAGGPCDGPVSSGSGAGPPRAPDAKSTPPCPRPPLAQLSLPLRAFSSSSSPETDPTAWWHAFHWATCAYLLDHTTNVDFFLIVFILFFMLKLSLHIKATKHQVYCSNSLSVSLPVYSVAAEL